MKVKTYAKVLCVALVMCFVLCGFTACSAKPVTVTVKDMGAETSVDAQTGMTVAQVLEAGKIALGDKDETEPAKDEKITEKTSEILVKRYAKVTVVYGDQKKELELTGATVEEAVKQAGFTTEADVKPDVPAEEFCKDGMTINLVKGVKVKLTVDGKTTDVTTYMSTVEDMLKEQKITLGKDDEVSEDLKAKVTEGMNITVKRVEYKEVKETEKVPYETKETYSDSMSAGSSEVTQAGADGEKEVTYKVKYVDGKEDSREKVSEKVTKEPVTELVTKGSGSSGGSNSGNSGSGDSGSGSGESGGGDSGSGGSNEPYEVSRTPVPDCDGSGHGYYVINWSDGSTTYEEY